MHFPKNNYTANYKAEDLGLDDFGACYMSCSDRPKCISFLESRVRNLRTSCVYANILSRTFDKINLYRFNVFMQMLPNVFFYFCNICKFRK